MKKRIFGMVLALVLVLGLVPVTAWATEAEEYHYGISSNAMTIEAGSSGVTEYTVKVELGEHIKVSSDSVDKLTQTVSAGGYFDNVYFYTESGYYFPEDYAATLNGLLNGLKITRMNSTQAFVTGIPTGNTEFVLPAAVEGLRGTATVSGKGVVGQTLTVKLTDSNAEGALSYQWMYDNGATAKHIQGATGSSYTLTKADLDQRVFVEIKDGSHHQTQPREGLYRHDRHHEDDDIGQNRRCRRGAVCRDGTERAGRQRDAAARQKAGRLSLDKRNGGGFHWSSLPVYLPGRENKT